jgi:integrase
MATAKKQKDGSWRIQPCVTVHGEKRRANIRAASKREAEQLALEWVVNNQGANKNTMDLGEAIDAYINSKSNVLSPSTLKCYKNLRQNVFPALMQRRIATITNEDIQIAVNELALAHSPKYVRNAFGLVTVALGVYRPDFRVRATLPQKKVDTMVIPEEDTVRCMYEAVKDTRLEVPFLLATQCGMRPSEIFALRPENVKDGYIEVTAAKVRGDKGLVTKAPKTAAGHRRIPAPQALCDLIKERAEGETVTTYHPDSLHKTWARHLKRHNVPYCRFYDLRHYYASNALLSGIPQKYISEFMGHSTEEMTKRVYTHTFNSAKSEFAEILAKRSADFLSANSAPKAEK